MPGDRPRSLADDLRARSDDELVALLQARPDLRTPVPADVTALAARSTTRPSVQRALDHLDAFTLQVVDVLVVLPDRAASRDVRALLGTDPSPALATLRTQGLVYGAGDELTLVRTAREVVGDPAGLGPPAAEALRGYGPARLAQLMRDLGLAPTGDPVDNARLVADRLGDRDALTGLLDHADPPARELLDSLTWGPPTGRVDRADRDVAVGTAATPLEWLLARGVIVALDAGTVVLPREVGIALRGGRVHTVVQSDPPDPDRHEVEPARVDRSAAGAAADAVRLVEELLETWAVDPPKVLRTGGLGVRDRTRTAAALDLDPDRLTLLVEAAYAAGLIAAGTDVDEVWLPTPEYDAWRTWNVADRWSTLAEAWLASPRVAGLAGGQDSRGKPLAPLGPELARAIAPGVRREVLGVLSSLPDGAATTEESVAELVRWRAPRLYGRLRAGLVAWTLREAEAFGLSSGTSLSGFGRLLVEGADDAAIDELDGLLPEAVDHVLLQADLTAVAPGPLTGELGQRLTLLADVESRGAATVYRFSGASVRRALDLGWTADEVLRFLADHSRTPVPQPLSYLVEDVARRHGRIRVGIASAYLRCDDETTLTEILADRRAAPLRLRRLAPTVVAAQAPVDVVLATLRGMGHAPTAESPDGDVVIRRPDARRADAARLVTPVRTFADGLPPAVVAAAVTAIRAGDRAAVHRPTDGPPSGSTVDVLALLNQAVRDRDTVWIGYVDAHGQPSQRLIEPEVVEGGYVEAFDHLRQERRRFAVHRITGAATIDESA